MWSLSLSLSSSFFTTFFHPLLSLSVSKKSTNLSPRLDRERERERNPRHWIQFPNLSLSLSLSLVDATILTKTPFTLSVSFLSRRRRRRRRRDSSSKRNLLFPVVEGVKFSPRPSFSKKCPRGKEKKRYTKNTKRALLIERTFFWKERAQTNKRRKEKFLKERAQAAALLLLQQQQLSHSHSLLVARIMYRSFFFFTLSFQFFLFRVLILLCLVWRKPRLRTIFTKLAAIANISSIFTTQK
jgi:hypothetical protein